MLTIDMRMEAKMAQPKLEKPKLLLPKTAEVKVSMKPFTTKLNNPKVTKVKGRERITKTGFTSIFKNERMKLAITAATQLDT